MNKKLEQFKQRNRKRNAHLYAAGLIEGHDYVVCPVSSERLSMIKDSYIVNILAMNPASYPQVQRVCTRRKENIKRGLREIDPNTGLTKYEVGQIKARKILNTVDSSGLSGYDRKGQKTRATHMSRVDEQGRNGYSRLATKAVIKGNLTKAKKGIISLNRNEFKRYKTVVQYLTEKHRVTLTQGFVTGLAGKQNAWHIDHIFSVLKGYQHKISPFVIGHINNLQMLPWEDNLSKHSACSITVDKLFENCGYSQNQSETEFNQVMNLIVSDIQDNMPPNAAYLLERLYETKICGQH
jgi:hypothetical protein